MRHASYPAKFPEKTCRVQGVQHLLAGPHHGYPLRVRRRARLRDRKHGFESRRARQSPAGEHTTSRPTRTGPPLCRGAIAHGTRRIMTAVFALTANGTIFTPPGNFRQRKVGETTGTKVPREKAHEADEHVVAVRGCVRALDQR